MLYDLQVGIEQVEQSEEYLDLEEDITNNVFNELLNQASCQLYPRCSEFSSLNFLVKMMHVKVFNGWSNKSFDMMLELIKRVFPMCGTNIPSSFYEVKRQLCDLELCDLNDPTLN